MKQIKQRQHDTYFHSLSRYSIYLFFRYNCMLYRTQLFDHFDYLKAWRVAVRQRLTNRWQDPRCIMEHTPTIRETTAQVAERRHWGKLRFKKFI